MNSHLQHPWGDMEFNVTLSWFLSLFDVVSRGERWEHELNEIDVNDQRALSRLAYRCLLTGKLVDELTPLHKREIMSALIQHLSCDSFDFDEMFSENWLASQNITLPSNWKVENGRRFFEILYEVHYETWKSELARFQLPDPAELRHPKA